MVRVMASGVFDLIHPGHISYLKQARAYGDELVVVVACDDTVRKKKHEPITPDYMRARIVENLKPVDRAIVGRNSGSIYDILEEIRPDVIVLGSSVYYSYPTGVIRAFMERLMFPIGTYLYEYPEGEEDGKHRLAHAEAAPAGVQLWWRPCG